MVGWNGCAGDVEMRELIMNRKWIISFISVGTLVAAIAISLAAKSPKAETGPTAEGALAADNEFAKAMKDNDANRIESLLSDDYAVIPTNGDVVEGKDTFPNGIKSGVLTKSVFQTTEPRVRLYGNTAVVTTKVVMAGVFHGKLYKDVGERQTEVWVWKDKAWKCVLTHETELKDMPGVISSDGGQHWTKIQ
jgi:ketosteroid isomerase-like protein